MSDLTRSPRPCGLGSDLGRWFGALAIGAIVGLGYWWGFPWAVSEAIRGGWM